MIYSFLAVFEKKIEKNVEKKGLGLVDGWITVALSPSPVNQSADGQLKPLGLAI